MEGFDNGVDTQMYSRCISVTFRTVDLYFIDLNKIKRKWSNDTQIDSTYVYAPFCNLNISANVKITQW